jgi:heme/copper-type cytochrome/quinol oxidase subunit 3
MRRGAKFVVIYSVAVIITFVAVFLAFYVLQRSYRVSPQLAAIYVYGRVLLMDTIPLVIAAFCCINSYNYMRSINYSMLKNIIVCVVVTALVFAGTFVATNALFKLLERLLQVLTSSN